MNTLVMAYGPQLTRIGLFRGEVLDDLLIEPSAAPSLVGHIFKGRVERVEEGLEAAFVDIGLHKPGYLGIKDILPPGQRGQVSIRDCVKGGRELLVQVLKDPREEKGVQLTTRITLPGRYLVLTPDEPGISLSHKIAGAERRRSLAEATAALLPEGVGAVVRTEAQDAEPDVLAEEAGRLTALWAQIAAYKVRGTAPLLVFREAGIGLRMVRRLRQVHIDRIITDNRQAALEVAEFIKTRGLPAPEMVYEGAALLMDRAVTEALEPCVPLKGGGSLWIESVRAMTVIDVNTGGRSDGGDAQDTFLRVNATAAAEIARQLRIRNLTGMILIDFIDLKRPEARKAVVEALKAATAEDRVPVTLVGFTRLGILEVTRKAEQAPVRQLLTVDCPLCGGNGRVEGNLMHLEALEREIAREAALAASDLILEAESALGTALRNGALGGLTALGSRYGLGITLRVVSGLSGYRLIRR